ncbi:uncharacterized protein BDZ83DRAFT_410682 [Colletotrichum acutatum]|uniref:Uncharacterized protein n=1 Tax=Glomerella acutata TaxID=27357 RepID=A0AAD8UER0_GLOAC|nr:uncharacterized protein BDZ83DRAFT_410682 [Colletotrichum acutatum]KAK1722852.1 hypothetical protein BDZ83DRAFT_410682 [Colletotrichum acutatum]
MSLMQRYPPSTLSAHNGAPIPLNSAPPYEYVLQNHPAQRCKQPVTRQRLPSACLLLPTSTLELNRHTSSARHIAPICALIRPQICSRRHHLLHHTLHGTHAEAVYIPGAATLRQRLGALPAPWPKTSVINPWARRDRPPVTSHELLTYSVHILVPSPLFNLSSAGPPHFHLFGTAIHTTCGTAVCYPIRPPLKSLLQKSATRFEDRGTRPQFK